MPTSSSTARTTSGLNLLITCCAWSMAKTPAGRGAGPRIPMAAATAIAAEWRLPLRCSRPIAQPTASSSTMAASSAPIMPITRSSPSGARTPAARPAGLCCASSSQAPVRASVARSATLPEGSRIRWTSRSRQTAACWWAITAPGRSPRSSGRAEKERSRWARRTHIGLVDRFRDMTDWLAQGEASASQGYLTSESGPSHRPSRAWYGQVMPGSWAPNIDADGVDGKLAGIAAIHQHDPAFDENVFLAQAQRLFFAVLEAWTALKPALSQGVMASVIWEQQKTQINAYRAKGWRNKLDGLGFTSAVIAGALSNSGFDTVTVRLNANSADYDLDAGSRVIHGDTNRWDWTEDWIFQRPSTTTTVQPGTITSQACPNCGTSVNVDITSICPFCDAAVISGRFGWLLTRIDRV